MTLRRTFATALLGSLPALTLALPIGNSTHLPPSPQNALSTESSPTFSHNHQQITSFTIFGDSLSDTGNVQLLLEILSGRKNPDLIFKPFNADLNYSGIEKFLGYLGIKIKGLVHLENDIARNLIRILNRIYRIPVYPDSNYYKGRFSNGPVWNEWLAPMMNVPVDDPERYINRAYGGSWAIDFRDDLKIRWNHLKEDIVRLINGKLIPPDQERLVNAYLDEYPDKINSQNHPDGGQAFAFFYGANDYLNDYQNVDRVVDRIFDQVIRVTEYLDKAPSRLPDWIVIANLPPLHRAPRFVHATVTERKKVEKVINAHNTLLEQRYREIRANYRGRVNIRFMDSYGLVTQELDSNEYKNTTDACYDDDLPTFLHDGIRLASVDTQLKRQAPVKPCAHPEDYAFWDGLHPSAKMHARIAWRLCENQLFQEMGAKCSGIPDFDNPDAFPENSQEPLSDNFSSETNRRNFHPPARPPAPQ